MSYQKEPGISNTIEVLDRVLDKGLVIDASVRVKIVGIALLDVDVRVVLASIETYVRYSEALDASGPIEMTEGPKWDPVPPGTSPSSPSADAAPGIIVERTDSDPANPPMDGDPGAMEEPIPPAN